ncbi:alpha/beta hydrolase [Alkalicoccobacillus plakortidis]|uniref:Alpha/beta hydrolase-fold protein n=1 Tax=Alkalicoccobacillus plakortidis TaxID=444060 RepID=A0ABT0XQ40_9BACI|nr:alpha/beta hydrolase-fold protein [Alkalicoccobacillus plakortidis]MCM2677354.1 alpha/beta hydrolase-fold protein [Alkalicoccobacillus plakortidis]
MFKQTGAYQVPNTIVWESSDGNFPKRQIYISIPSVEAPSDGFPVLFVLDGNAWFGAITEFSRLQTRAPHGYPPTIIVGIGYETDEPFCRQSRFYDFTEKVDSSELGQLKQVQANQTGGVSSFLQFFENELIPSLEKAYPLHQTKRALFGHSLGGLCVLHTLIHKSSLFSTYIAGSPSIWWKEGYLKELVHSFKSLDVKDILIGVGENEKGHMVDDAEWMYEQIRGKDHIEAQYICIPDTGHMSVVPPFLNTALKFFLATGAESGRL